MPAEEEIIQSFNPINNAEEMISEKSSRFKPLAPIILISAIIFAVVSGFYVSKLLKSPEVEPTAVNATANTHYVKLSPEFTVNLNSSGQYLETEIVFKANNREVNAEVSKKKPEVRDKIISILASQSYTNLLTQTGKEELKTQLKLGVNSFLTKGIIIEVYFNTFIMQ